MSTEEKRSVPAEGSNRGHDMQGDRISNVSNTMSGEPPAFAGEETLGRNDPDQVDPNDPAISTGDQVGGQSSHAEFESAEDRDGEDDMEEEHPADPSFGRSRTASLNCADLGRSSGEKLQSAPFRLLADRAGDDDRLAGTNHTGRTMMLRDMRAVADIC